MYRVKNVELSSIMLYSDAEEVRTTDLDHAHKVAKKDKTSGWTYRVEVHIFLSWWKLVAAYKCGQRIDECGCRVIRK